MRFARILPNNLFRDIIEMSSEEYNSLLINNPNKAALLRPLVTDPLPTINAATEKITTGPIVIEPLQARETWIVSLKTQQELDAENQESAANSYYSNLTTTLADLTAGTGNNDARIARVEAACIRMLNDWNTRRSASNQFAINFSSESLLEEVKTSSNKTVTSTKKTKTQ